MREEVGRSIGLSARKVQVCLNRSCLCQIMSMFISFDFRSGSRQVFAWLIFGTHREELTIWHRPLSQNQRQKARRPRNQSSPPPTRLSQYGAYANAPAPTSAASIAGPSIFPTHEEQVPFRTAPSVPFVQFNMNRAHSSHEDVLGASVTGTGSSSGSSHLSGPGVPGVSTSFAPRFPSSLPPMTAPSSSSSSSISGHRDSPHRRPPSNGHGNARHSAPPSRDFTFNFPFPPLQVPHATQNWFPPPHRMTASPPHLSLVGEQPQSRQRRMSFTPPGSRPHTPRSSSLVPPPHSRLESARDLPRLRIPPLHVPESPHARQRSSLPYSPSQDPFRAVLSTTTTTTSGSSRGGSPSAPRARRFDPVREAASERSASQGTDSSTPPRIDTPHV
jgi:hypothetical protein